MKRVTRNLTDRFCRLLAIAGRDPMDVRAQDSSAARLSRSRATAWSVLLLFATLICSPGCSVMYLAKRTIKYEPRDFDLTLDEAAACKQYAIWAEEEWGRYLDTASQVSISPDYERGFREGFVDYVFAGGNGEPPPVPPRRFWRTMYRNPEGDQSINEWSAGFRIGAGVARDNGYRRRAMVPALSTSAKQNHQSPNWAEQEGILLNDPNLELIIDDPNQSSNVIQSPVEMAPPYESIPENVVPLENGELPLASPEQNVPLQDVPDEFPQSLRSPSDASDTGNPFKDDELPDGAAPSQTVPESVPNRAAPQTQSLPAQPSGRPQRRPSPPGNAGDPFQNDNVDALDNLFDTLPGAGSGDSGDTRPDFEPDALPAEDLFEELFGDEPTPTEAYRREPPPSDRVIQDQTTEPHVLATATKEVKKTNTALASQQRKANNQPQTSSSVQSQHQAQPVDLGKAQVANAQLTKAQHAKAQSRQPQRISDALPPARMQPIPSYQPPNDLPAKPADWRIAGLTSERFGRHGNQHMPPQMPAPTEVDRIADMLVGSSVPTNEYVGNEHADSAATTAANPIASQSTPLAGSPDRRTLSRKGGGGTNQNTQEPASVVQDSSPAQQVAAHQPAAIQPTSNNGSPKPTNLVLSADPLEIDDGPIAASQDRQIATVSFEQEHRVKENHSPQIPRPLSNERPNARSNMTGGPSPQAAPQAAPVDQPAVNLADKPAATLADSFETDPIGFDTGEPNLGDSFSSATRLIPAIDPNQLQSTPARPQSPALSADGISSANGNLSANGIRPGVSPATNDATGFRELPIQQPTPILLSPSVVEEQKAPSFFAAPPTNPRDSTRKTQRTHEPTTGPSSATERVLRHRNMFHGPAGYQTDYQRYNGLYQHPVSRGG